MSMLWYLNLEKFMLISMRISFVILIEMKPYAQNDQSLWDKQFKDESAREAMCPNLFYEIQCISADCSGIVWIDIVAPVYALSIFTQYPLKHPNFKLKVQTLLHELALNVPLMSKSRNL